MITPIETPWEPDIWRRELQQAIRTSSELLQYVKVQSEFASDDEPFPVRVPRGFADRMVPGDENDPLLRQVLATTHEQIDVPGFVRDPLQEQSDRNLIHPAPGLLHKYHGRALLITTGACAINCRYCFRRHFPYADHQQSRHEKALAAVQKNESIEEVILSGGDPLLLDDRALQRLVDSLAHIRHLQRLRIHTRIPVVLPTRVTLALVEMLSTSRLEVVMVIHSNHAQELDAATARSLAALSKAGIHLLNQAVLLKGVNDNLPAQTALAKTLFTQRVMPYYLHLPDRVAGTAHFFINDNDAVELHRNMQTHLPGYLVAKLVREQAGELSKTIVST
ncbi:MAG: EF-P beta-lysylation protein EpmB [Pseudomonadales bacterium]|jgi:EF-P beta-lysylation protein EpmB|nr:EF-P beta-lysylation protein EpmB [Pseudomonadales bacterium]